MPSSGYDPAEPASLTLAERPKAASPKSTSNVDNRGVERMSVFAFWFDLAQPMTLARTVQADPYNLLDFGVDQSGMDCAAAASRPVPAA